MFPLAAAAYSNYPEACLTTSGIFSNASLYRLANISCDGHSTDQCAAYTALLHKERAVVLAFRGTASFAQLVIEGGDTMFKPRVESPIGGMVSE